MGWLLLALWALFYLALGPWTLVLTAVLLAVPRVRDRVPRPTVTRKGVAIGAGALVAASALVWAVPDGRLPIPHAGGLLVAPAYDGRQVSATPIEAEQPPAHPWLARMGSDAVNNDAWSSGAQLGPGPLGDRPQTDSAWYGLEKCGRMAFDSAGRIVALCHDHRGAVLRVIDPDSLRPLSSKRLPDRRETEASPWQDLCHGSQFYLDNGDRAVVTTTERRIQAVGTADAEGRPDLTIEESWSLESLVPESDCLVTVKPDWSGRIWWASRDGRVGLVDPVSGAVHGLELGEKVTNSIAVDENGGVFVVSDTALYRFTADASGAPGITWRTEYDRGVERKDGQLVQGSGTSPTLVDQGLVAIADNAEPRLHVVFLDRSSGAEVCRSAVFDGGESATETSLTSVGSGVVVENNHGYSTPTSTLLGFSSSPGLARVDHVDGECQVAWTNDEVVPSAVPTVSWQTGLIYAWTKRPSLWGVSGWYLTAIDAHTGQTAFSVRGGTGPLFNNHYAAVTLGPEGAAYVGTIGGLVKVRDVVRKPKDD
ncbi:hypothetical protein [Nocardioides campestrisoli]|uniref:hypothetical protein n=1 Tax=Nocardioides campestrisoli TaxID=2736757 RepID=UPI0015E63E70|nr:hypothetical protein [Nocardioides campestrisoli]